MFYYIKITSDTGKEIEIDARDGSPMQRFLKAVCIKIDTVDDNVSNRASSVLNRVCAVSHSAKMDMEPHNCLYQDPDKRMSHILEYIGKNQTGAQLSCRNDRSIPEPIVRSGETDFMFLVRMSEYTQQQLIIRDSDSHDGIKIVVAKTLPDRTFNIETDPDKLSVKKDIPKTGSPEQTIVQFILHDQYIDVGRQIQLKKAGFTGYIARCEIVLERNSMQYRYTAYDLDRMPEPPALIRPNAVMDAVVEDDQNPDGRCSIRVKVIGDYSDAAPGRAMWIPYQVPYFAEKAAAVFLPNKGDRVTLIFNEGVLTAQAYNGEYSLDKKLRGQQNQYISTVFGKQLVFREDAVEIHSDKSTLTVGNDKISVQVGNTVFVLSESEIALKINGTQIKIDRDVVVETKAVNVHGRNASIKTSGSIILDGDKVFLK